MITSMSVANGKDAISILNFTKDQLNAYNELLEFINNDYNDNDYKRALVGPAGTGKTYLVKALIKNCNYSYSSIGLSAPTHKACRVLNDSIKISNIKINSLQSDLGLRPNFDVEKFDINNPPFDPKGRIKIEDYKVYIIDESSMINRGLKKLIEDICKTNKCKIIYIGDEYQLPPVNDTHSPALRGVRISKLNQIVRQGDDNPVSELLPMLRYDIEHNTITFLNYISQNKSKFNSDFTKGYQVCNQFEFEHTILTYFSDDKLTKNVNYAKIIAYTNPVVASWNKYIRQAIIKDCDKSILTQHDLILSYTTLINQFNEAIIKNSEEYIIKDIVNYSHPNYNLKGFLVRFIAIHGGNVTTPIFVVDHTDKFTIQKYIKLTSNFINSAKSANNKIRAQKWKEYFEFKESCLLLTNILKTDGTILYNRGLDYGFALTTHKAQGSTFDTVFVDVNDVVYDRLGHIRGDIKQINRTLYTACSRCKNKLYLRFGQ